MGADPVAYVPTLIRNEDDSKMWANAVGSVFEKGYPLEWKNIYPNPKHIKLPNYSFENKVSNPNLYISMPYFNMIFQILIDSQLDESYFRLHGPFGAGPLLGRAVS